MLGLFLLWKEGWSSKFQLFYRANNYNFVHVSHPRVPQLAGSNTSGANEGKLGVIIMNVSSPHLTHLLFFE